MIEHYTYEKMEAFAFQEAKQGNACCGDSYFMTETRDYFLCLLVDGLGSGIEAKQAADQAISVVKQNPGEDLQKLMSTCNKALQAGRGAVLSMFKIFFHSHRLVFCGVGNIRFMFFTPDGKINTPLPTVGFMSGRPQSYRVQTLPYELGSSFMIYSDGLEMNVENHRAMLNAVSLKEASRHMERLLERRKDQNDDVTLLFGKSV